MAKGSTFSWGSVVVLIMLDLMIANKQDEYPV